MSPDQPRSKPQLVKRPAFECIALLLQGGGALGAYQAGVYEALAEAGVYPDWVAGISIGGINAAIIAGNPPEKRVQNLRKFWELITPISIWDSSCATKSTLLKNDTMRSFINQMSASSALLNGVANFFSPRIPTPWLHKSGSLDATSYYDTSKLKATIEELIDFDLINAGKIRLSLGSVNVKTGNFICFDTQTHKIGPEHVMASAALPPGFPAIEIDGDYYWDGGLVSNTPLQWVVDNIPRLDTLTFQVDLWSAEGEFPRDMAEVMTRQKEIQYSSRTRANTDRFKNAQKLHHAFAALHDQLPEELRKTPEAKLLSSVADRKVYNIVHLIYRTRTYEGDSKDYEFSRMSMEDHWQAGYADTLQTLGHEQVLERPTNPEGIAIYDFCHTTKAAPNVQREAAE
jgi:NTE family protein